MEFEELNREPAPALSKEGNQKVERLEVALKEAKER